MMDVETIYSIGFVQVKAIAFSKPGVKAGFYFNLIGHLKDRFQPKAPFLIEIMIPLCIPQHGGLFVR